MVTSTLVRHLVEVSEDPELPPDWSVTTYLSDNTLSDSRSLVMIPLLASLGFKVPLFQRMTIFLISVCHCISYALYLKSLKSVDDAARNVEKLKLLPGFNPNLSLHQLRSQLTDIGCFVGSCTV